VFGNTGATALAGSRIFQEEFMLKNSCVFIFVVKHFGKRYLCQRVIVVSCMCMHVYRRVRRDVFVIVILSFCTYLKVERAETSQLNCETSRNQPLNTSKTRKLAIKFNKNSQVPNFRNS